MNQAHVLTTYRREEILCLQQGIEEKRSYVYHKVVTLNLKKDNLDAPQQEHQLLKEFGHFSKQ